jgi:hypothetical protein
MNKERLLKLADFLETLPAERFRIRTWASPHFTPTDCNTTACACGWATTIPEFADAGLKLEKDCGELYLTYNGYKRSEAAARFFEISDYAAEYLFLPSEDDSEDREFLPGNASALDVATRIREVVERKYR